MSTFTEITYQVVFGAKYRIKFLNEAHQEKLFSYIGGKLKEMDCIPFIQGGHEDHIHMIFSLSRKYALSKVVQEVKKSSNSFLKEKEDLFPNFKAWQVGYGGFTYSKSKREYLINYVRNQKNHHKNITFMEEYVNLLLKHGIKFEEKYLFI